jgi:hypothetical protein
MIDHCMPPYNKNEETRSKCKRITAGRRAYLPYYERAVRMFSSSNKHS